MLEILKPDFIHADERGMLVQLVRDGYKQFNVISSNKDMIRGRHFHKKCSEAFYVVSGKIELLLSKDGKKETYTFSSGDMFKVEPYTTHTFKYLEDTILISMYDTGVEMPDGTKDIYNETEETI